MIEWETRENGATTMNDRYLHLFGKPLAENALQITSANWTFYGITETPTGKYMLFWNMFLSCNPLEFDTLDAAKAAAEFIEDREGLLR